MKKFLFFVSMLFASNMLFAQGSQLSRNDLGAVLQKCIDLPGLQSHLPRQGENLKPLYIGYYVPEIIPTDLQLFKEGNKVQFKEIISSESDIAEDFFLFDRIQQNGNTTKISFRFFSNTSGAKKVVQVNVELSNTENTWTITQSEITLK